MISTQCFKPGSSTLAVARTESKGVLKQNQAVGQRQRFSQVRFGSQADLIVPLFARFDFDTVAEIGDHLKAGIDPIIKVMEKMELR